MKTLQLPSQCFDFFLNLYNQIVRDGNEYF